MISISKVGLGCNAFSLKNGKSIIIIGAGFSDLSAGGYAQGNGYQAQIFEQHELPGGLTFRPQCDPHPVQTR